MSMAEERRAPQVAVVQPVIRAIQGMDENEAQAVQNAIRTIGVKPGEPVDLPTAPAGYPYQAQRPSLASAPLLIYRRCRPDERGDFLVVSLMTPEEFRQQKQDEQSAALSNPDVRREIAIVAGTAATMVSADPGSVNITPTSGGAASTIGPNAPSPGETRPIR